MICIVLFNFLFLGGGGWGGMVLFCLGVWVGGILQFTNDGMVLLCLGVWVGGILQFTVAVCVFVKLCLLKGSRLERGVH
jgi:hypothetical protein